MNFIKSLKRNLKWFLFGAGLSAATTTCVLNWRRAQQVLSNPTWRNEGSEIRQATIDRRDKFWRQSDSINARMARLIERAEREREIIN